MLAPNFFIVGAPKCGTTALSEYLREHPAVFLSRPKEPNYFAEDLPGIRYATTLREYQRLFQNRKPRHKAVGEASVWYLYSSVALQRIHSYNKDARIIVMLRNPVDMIRSLHGNMLYAFNEDRTDLADAWRLQELRHRGFELPKNCFEPNLLQYAAIGRFSEQVERLLGIFPRNQVYFSILDDWIADARREYQAVLDFLGLPDDGRSFFPKINVQKGHRFQLLGSLLLRPPAAARALWKKLRLLTGPSISLPLEYIIRMNSKARSHPPISPEMSQALKTCFARDVVNLGRLIERDFTHWF